MYFWCHHFLPKKRTKTSQQVVKSNLFIRFLEETLAWKNNFEFVWPLDRSIRTNLAYRVSLVSNSYLSRASTISNSKATLCIHWAWAFSISAKDWPSENPAEFPWTKMISLKAVAAPCRSSQEELKKELKINRIFLDWFKTFWTLDKRQISFLV